MTFIIADEYGTVYIEPDDGDGARVMSYQTLEVAVTEAAALNDRSGFILLPDGSAERSRPWRVFELREIRRE